MTDEELVQAARQGDPDAFDQLVARTTAYIPRARVEVWLSDPRVEPGSSYIVLRNGNSWKFGGVRRVSA